MANPTITDLPPVPTRNDAPAAFVDKADAFLGALPQFQAEANALGGAVEADAAQTAADRVQTGLDRASATASASSALNSPGSSGTSTTSLLIGAGTKTLTTQAGKAWSVGQGIVVASTANPLNQMSGVMTAYNAATGAMTVEVSAVGGSGTFAAWAISLAAGAAMAVASQAEAEAGTDPSKVMTPLRTAQAATARICSQVEAEAGVDNFKAMTPLRTAQAVTALAGSVGDIVYSMGSHDSRWLVANGNVVLKSSYPALFSLLGQAPNNLISTWPAASTGLGASIVGNIAFGNGRWVVVSASGGAAVSTNDCVSWVNNPGPGAAYAGTGGTASSQGGLMAYGAGLFVIFNASSGNRATSPDGVSWTSRIGGLNPNILGLGGYLQGVTFANSMFVAWGVYGVNANVFDDESVNVQPVMVPFVFTSTDALNWSRPTFSVSGGLSQYYISSSNCSIKTITYADGYFLSVGLRPLYTTTYGYAGFIHTSTDGVTWVERVNGALTSGNLSCGGVNGGGIAVVIFGASSYRSTNMGVSWSNLSLSPLFSGNPLIYSAGVFLYVTSSLQVMTSSDAITWTSRGTSIFSSSGFGCIAVNSTVGTVCAGVTTTSNAFYWNPYTYNSSNQFILPAVTPIAIPSMTSAKAYIKAI